MRLTLPSRQATIARLPQIKSSLWCQNMYSTQGRSFEHNPNLFPKACLPQAGMNLVIQPRVSRGWITNTKSLCACAPERFGAQVRSLRLCGESIIPLSLSLPQGDDVLDIVLPV